MNQSLAQAFITVLTGSADTVIDFRVINDRDKGCQGRNITGTLEQCWQELTAYNQQGWGVFMCVNAIKAGGRKILENVDHIRTHVADLDDVLNSQDGYNRAVASALPPHIAVQSSPGKFHLYWLTEPYAGNDFYRAQQEKLIQLYNSDPQVKDATRVLRVPGFYHCKGEPHLVTCWQIHNHPRYTWQQIQAHLEAVNVIQRISTRKPLGDPKLAAPSLDWLHRALDSIDPNSMGRDEWMPITAAFKQAGWSLADEQTLRDIWERWCAQYEDNDLKVNEKLWNSIRDSEVGWGRFERVTSVKAHMMFENADPNYRPAPVPEPQQPDPRDRLPDILEFGDKAVWFKDCYYIGNMGRIFSPTGRFMDSTKFNGLYGGRRFSLGQSSGAPTDEAWRAALRSTDWTIPKVDHVRFVPSMPTYAIIKDEMDREGLNTYIPAKIDAVQGDVQLWFDLLHKILPTHEDVQMFDAYLAHNIKFPGHKIPWSVLLQSAEGVGKQAIAGVVKYCIGNNYTYEPDAEKFVNGSNFNGWMRNKLMIIVDEIRVGDRRDLLEKMKKIITDSRIAVESKGVDQEMEDNPANWLFFSNFKDAIPVGENNRRYCIFFSKLQSARAIAQAGMGKEYFERLFNWLNNGGYQAVAWYYRNHSIQQGSLPHRAPKTSSYEEVLRIGRSPLEVLLDSKIEAGERGFRGGYVSWPMLLKAVEQSSMRHKPSEYIVRGMLEGRGYVELGSTAAPVGGEDLTRGSLLFGLDANLRVEDYERSQM